MKNYPNCPVCKSKPFFNVKRPISIDGNNPIERVEIEECLIKVSGEHNPEESVSICTKCRSAYRRKFFDDKELAEIYNKAYYKIEERISRLDEFIYNDYEFLNGYSMSIYSMVKDKENIHTGFIAEYLL